jgi:predicted nicotinamide N-methyase
MDPQTLPAEEQALYQKIRKEYQVAFEPLAVGPVRLNLLTVTDLEPLLEGKDPLKDPTTFPFWVKLWEAAIVLARYLALQKFAPGTRLLELGAGLGAPGLAAAAVGCEVTLSDYEETILEFERVSAAASKVHVACRLLDWKNPPAMDRYDVIVGAEILFREEFFAPLLQVIRAALKPGGVVYLAHDARRQSLRPFLEMAADEYAIAASKNTLRSLDEDRVILLNRLTPKS